MTQEERQEIVEKIKTEARAMIDQGNEFCDRVQEYQKVMTPTILKLLNAINPDDHGTAISQLQEESPELLDLQAEVQALNERLMKALG